MHSAPHTGRGSHACGPFTSPARLFHPARVFHLNEHYSPSWPKLRTQSMVLPASTGPLSDHESVSAPPYARLKHERTLQRWGEHGTSPKEPFPSRVRPPYVRILHSEVLTKALRNAAAQRKCVVSHVVSVDRSISRYLAGRRSPLCLCESMGGGDL